LVDDRPHGRRANGKRDDIYVEVEEDSLVDERAGRRRSLPVRPVSVSVDESSLVGTRPSGRKGGGRPASVVYSGDSDSLVDDGYRRGGGRGIGRNILGRMGMRGRCGEKGGRY